MDKKINLRRWFDVVLLGVVSYALVLLIAEFSPMQKLYQGWVNNVLSLPPTAQFIVAAAGVCLVVYALGYFNVIHRDQFKRLHLSLHYPPIVVSIILSVVLLSLHYEWIAEAVEQYFAKSVLLIFSLLFLRCVWVSSDYVRCERYARHDVMENVVIPAWINDDNEVNHYRWLMTEKPISGIDEDKLVRDSYVERLSELFVSGDNTVHAAIIGPFGIGKSSIWKCVESNLTRKCGEKFIFVAIDGWGRSEKAAAAQIIDGIVRGLSQYVDCASIRDVPKEYMEALAGLDLSGASVLAKILPVHSRKSPEELLGSIDAILVSIGKCIVVVLEDFDRNPNPNVMMNDVAGLLDRLRHLKSINFIVCLTPGVEPNLINRVSNHREDLLSFDAKDILNETITLMRSHANKMIEGDIICFDYDRYQFVRALNSIIKTPRDVKYALRRTYTAWRRLAGEVNIDDLLAANVLRYSAPAAFDFFTKNFRALRDEVCNDRSITASSGIASSAEANSELRDEFESLLSEAGADEDQVSLLVKVFIPEWHPRVGLGFNSLRVAGLQGAIYLERIASESIAKEHVANKDSDFLKEIYDPTASDYMGKVAASKYLTEKFIEFVGHSCDIDWNLKLISKKYTELLIERCKLGKDVFHSDGLQISDHAISWIIEKLYEKTGENVVANFIEAMQSDPEAIFVSLKKSKDHLEFKFARYEPWARCKRELERCLLQAASLSVEAKAEAEGLIRELDSDVG